MFKYCEYPSANLLMKKTMNTAGQKPICKNHDLRVSYGKKEDGLSNETQCPSDCDQSVALIKIKDYMIETVSQSFSNNIQRS